MININVDYMLNTVIDEYDNFEDLKKAEKHIQTYRANHLEGTESYEQLMDHYNFINDWVCSTRDSIYAICNTLMKDDAEAHERLYIAARATRKWYRKTNWERCLSNDVLHRLGKFIFDAKPIEYTDYFIHHDKTLVSF